MRIESELRAADLAPALQRLWQASAAKIHDIEESWRSADGAPVYTVEGRYTSRGWTDWTQGFQFGYSIFLKDYGQRVRVIYQTILNPLLVPL